MKKHTSILSLIGNTPLIKLNRVIGKTPHTFWAKVEFFNPGGSVKDRMASAIIEQAEKRGDLKPGGTIVEATSGNTGVGLALIAAVKGYKCVVTISDKMSQEKIDTLRAMGAEVVITPAGVEPDDPRSHYSVAKKIARERENSFLANQYDNPDNPEIHYKTTGPEIWDQSGGEIDILVAGIGTGGTLSGTGRYLKDRNSKLKVVCADPIGSILFDLFYHKEIRSPAAPYLVEGIGEDMLPKNVHFDVIDDIVQVNDKDSFDLCRRLLSEEGLYVGPSSGAALSAALKYSKKFDEPKNIVMIFPDSGNRYLSKAFNEKWMKEKDLL